MNNYPKVKWVKPLDDNKLLVGFTTDIVKVYNCAPLLAEPTFSILRQPAFFRSVQVDRGGYGIFWNDELDLSESELWLHGEIVTAEVWQPNHDLEIAPSATPQS